ncbi:MAG: nucleoside triphosphate pyrophosphatase [Thiolinea sp.]
MLTPAVPSRKLVLASTSVYRRALLEKLQIAFSTAAPDLDETRLAQETAAAMVERLALEKARAVAANHADALIIGSDQCAVLDEQVLGKPGNHAHATAQLQACSGRVVRFLTGLCLYDAANHEYQLETATFDVHFRTLDAADIEAYLQREQPYDCAGSFKSEGLGISLFERLQGDDPNALVGLPLIRLVALLRRQGVQIPAPVSGV